VTWSNRDMWSYFWKFFYFLLWFVLDHGNSQAIHSNHLPTIFFLYWVVANVDTSCSYIASVQSLIYTPGSPTDKNLCFELLTNQKFDLLLYLVASGGGSCSRSHGSTAVALSLPSSGKWRNLPNFWWWIVHSCTTCYPTTSRATAPTVGEWTDAIREWPVSIWTASVSISRHPVQI
jgi:hypothetical protein